MSRALLALICFVAISSHFSLINGQLILWDAEQIEDSDETPSTSIEEKELIREMNIIEEEIESSLGRAEKTLESIQHEIQFDEDIQSDEDRIESLQKSLDDFRKVDEAEEKKNPSLPTEIKIAKNLINDSILQEIEIELDEDQMISPNPTEDSQPLSTPNQRFSHAETRKTMKQMLANERSRLEQKRDEIKSSDEKYAAQPTDEPEISEFTSENNWKLKYSQDIRKAEEDSVQNIIDLMTDKLKIMDSSTAKELSSSNKNSSEKSARTDWFQGSLTQQNVATVVNEDGKIIETIKVQLDSDNSRKQQIDNKVNEILEKGDQLHKQLEFIEEEIGEENQKIQKITAKSKQRQRDGSQSSDDSDQSQNIDSLDGQPKENIDDNKLFIFLIILMLLMTLLIFLSRFDMFKFFTLKSSWNILRKKQNKSKRQTIEEQDDEAAQRLIY